MTRPLGQPRIECARAACACQDRDRVSTHCLETKSLRRVGHACARSRSGGSVEHPGRLKPGCRGDVRRCRGRRVVHLGWRTGACDPYAAQACLSTGPGAWRAGGMGWSGRAGTAASPAVQRGLHGTIVESARSAAIRGRKTNRYMNGQAWRRASRVAAGVDSGDGGATRSNVALWGGGGTPDEAASTNPNAG